MILYKSPLIFGIIKKMVGVFFTVIYKIFAFFNLQITLLFSLIGLVLYITGIFEQNRVVLIVFYLLLVLSIIYAIASTIKKLLGVNVDNKSVKKSKGMQIISNQQSEAVEGEKPQSVEKEPVKVEAPTYYTVRQNNNFIMAEYSDRYELYRKTSEGLKKVRTDYK